jgi:hypothetical protein
MLAFMLGLGLVYTVAAAATLATEPAVRPDNPWVVSLVLVVWLLPVCAGWGAAEMVRLVRGGGARLRAFNPAHSWWLGRMTRGVVAGLIGVGASLAALVYVNEPPSDAVVMGLGGAVGAAAVLLFGRRVKAGACVGCGYDLRGLTSASGGRCPECGAGVQAVMA